MAGWGAWREGGLGGPAGKAGWGHAGEINQMKKEPVTSNADFKKE